MKKNFEGPGFQQFRWAPLNAVTSFVSQYEIRSVREYQRVLSKFQSTGQYTNLPFDAAKAYGEKWSKILFSNQKFNSYYNALAALARLGVTTRAGFQLLSKDDRKKLKLPSTMSFYKEFPGWAKLRKSRVLSLESLKAHCLQRRFYTKEQYLEFSRSSEGKGLGFPENPRYAYGKKWRGWDYLLPKKEARVIFEERLEKLKQRSSRMMQNSQDATPEKLCA